MGFSSRIAVDFLVCTDHVEIDIGNINIILNAAMLKKDPGSELAMNIGFVWFIVSCVGSYNNNNFVLPLMSAVMFGFVAVSENSGINFG